MERLTHGRAIIIAAVILLDFGACDGSSVAAPKTSQTLAFRINPTVLPELTPYSGVLQPGRFIVCTSRFSPAAAYTYSISDVAKEKHDQYVTSVTIAPGECAVVYEIVGKKGDSPKEQHKHPPSITVTGDPLGLSDGGVRLDANGSHEFIDCFDATPLTVTMSGYEGAVTKFYYSSPIHPSVIITCTIGGHGGTSTATFGVD
jgi:hypothetical protein